ncbi:MAG: DNA polymerase III subunit delta' [Deltaproteobacteria bacterium]|nr:DNA polymerase III subunit delta' [Deltaproteobacteria bacterium]
MANPKKDKATAAPPAPAPGPRFFREILGQEWVVSHLKTARQKGRLAHAYLFLGPEGVGKASTAQALAAALNCQAPLEDGDACGVCPSCRRLAAGTHPDFLVIEPTSEGHQPQIKIEQIREFRRLTSYPPLGGGWRVALIKPAEALTAQNDAAANALLKTLEEPPDRHLIILTTQVEADLLPTVVSRCHKLAFAPLPAALIAGELERRRGLAPPQAQLLAALSGGSLGRALSLDPEAILAQRRQVLADLGALATGSAAAALDWAQRLAKSRPDLDHFLSLAQMWYRDLLLCHFQAPAALLAHQDLLADLAREAAATKPTTVFQQFTALSTAQRHLQANLNPELTLDILGLRLQRRGQSHGSR